MTILRHGNYIDCFLINSLAMQYEYMDVFLNIFWAVEYYSLNSLNKKMRWQKCCLKLINAFMDIFE